MKNRRGATPVGEPPARPVKIIAVASGKGGVGKTSVAINLAISLTRFGHRVMVVDADMGLANVDLMLGLTPKFNLSHVLERKKTFNEIIITGPSGIKLVPCSSGGRRDVEFDTEKRRELIGTLRQNTDFADTVFIDTGGGISDNIVDFLLLADEVFLVTTPEPTAIMDSYGVIRTLAREMKSPRVRLIVNMVNDPGDARHALSTMQLVTRQFFNIDFDCIGSIGYDQNVTRAIRRQQAAVLMYPSTRAARDFDRIAMKLADYEVDFVTERGVKALLSRFVSYLK